MGPQRPDCKTEALFFAFNKNTKNSSPATFTPAGLGFSCFLPKCTLPVLSRPRQHSPNLSTASSAAGKTSLGRHLKSSDSRLPTSAVNVVASFQITASSHAVQNHEDFSAAIAALPELLRIDPAAWVHANGWNIPEWVSPTSNRLSTATNWRL